MGEGSTKNVLSGKKRFQNQPKICLIKKRTFLYHGVSGRKGSQHGIATDAGDVGLKLTMEPDDNGNICLRFTSRPNMKMVYLEIVVKYASSNTIW